MPSLVVLPVSISSFVKRISPTVEQQPITVGLQPIILTFGSLDLVCLPLVPNRVFELLVHFEVASKQMSLVPDAELLHLQT